jgi:hypothetical protein
MLEFNPCPDGDVLHEQFHRRQRVLYVSAVAEALLALLVGVGAYVLGGVGIWRADWDMVRHSLVLWLVAISLGSLVRLSVRLNSHMVRQEGARLAVDQLGVASQVERFLKEHHSDS